MNVAQLITTDYRRALIGIGVTGRSVVRRLLAENKRLDVFDSRQQPPGLAQFKQDFPEVQLHLGDIQPGDLGGYREVILSPGIDPSEPWLSAAVASDAEIIGDIELFAQRVEAPVVAITGSNAKSTVTTLLGQMAEAAGVRVAVGGNLGMAALDLLQPESELYVLELSSFQLELIKSLKPAAACILNLSPDHMDRYPNMLAYHGAKQRVYSGATHLVYNHDDLLTQPLIQEGQTAMSFGMSRPDLNQYGLDVRQGETYLVKGHDEILAARDLQIKGQHNLCNVLAALALGEAIGLPMAAMKQAAIEFSGLAHRTQVVADRNGVVWIDDSKATNVGAVKAALAGLGSEKNIVLIAGGQAKGQDFSDLAPLIKKHVKQLVLIGEDADQFAKDVSGAAPSVLAVDMRAAVQTAQQVAFSGDIVLLSPACASFDMFSGYEERGRVFAEQVGALL